MSHLKSSPPVGVSSQLKPRALAPSKMNGWKSAVRHGVVVCCALGMATFVSGAAHATDFFKADNATSLNSTAAYVLADGSTPAALPNNTTDVIVFDNRLSAANAALVNLTGTLSVAGVRVADPQGPVTIGGNQTFSLSNLGVDLSTATQDLSFNVSFLRQDPNAIPFNVAAGRTVTLSANTTFNARTATKTATFTGAGTVIFNGPIINGGGVVGFIINNAAGTVVVSNAGNTNTGVTTITAGTLRIDSAGGLPSSTVTVTPANGLLFGNGITTTVLGSLAGAGAVALANTAGAGVNLQVGNNNGTTTYSGALTGAGSLSKIGTGTLTLSGGNTFTGGTSVNAGIVATGSDGAAFGDAAGPVTLNNGQINLGTSGSGQVSIPNPIVVSGTTSALFTLGTGATQTLTGPISGSATLALGLGSQLTLSGGANQLTSFSGTFSFGASTGPLRLQGTGAANSGTNGQNATFDVGTATSTLTTRDSATIRLGALNALGTGTRLNGSGNDAAATTYEIGAKNLSTTFAGIIGNGTFTTPGITNITKVGTGTLTLTGSNTYTGATTVNAGTLALGAADRIADASGLNLGGGTFNTGGFGETLAALNLTAATISNLDLGNGASVVNFSGFGTGTGSVNLLNYSSGDRVFIGTSAALTPAQLGQITFVNPGGVAGNRPAQQLPSGELVPGTSAAATSGAIITEFRFHGAAGAADEYVEVRNKTTGPLDISGWSLQTRSAAGLQTTLVPSNTIIPTFGHFLFTGSGYSLTGYGTGNAAIAADVLDNSGAALFNAAGAVQDAVGFAASDTTLREGAGLAAYPTADGEYAFMRDFTVSQEKDTTADSSQDFVFVSTSGAGVSGETAPGSATTVPAQLGAPSPEGLSSPSYFNNQTTSNLLDPSVGSGASPNRIKVASAGTLGFLVVRRTIRNNSSVAITRLRFGVTSISSLGSAGDTGAGSAQADVRLVSQAAESGVMLANGTLVNVEGTTLEAGANQPQQPLNGGLGSSMNNDTVTLGTPLAAGATRNYAFRVQILRGGNYFIYFNILALTQ